MKRPEGFSTENSSTGESGTGRTSIGRPPRLAAPTGRRPGAESADTAPARDPRKVLAARLRTHERRSARALKPVDRQAKRDVRVAARARRRYEKKEVRRFTRQSRRRRITVAVLAGIAVTMAGLVAVAVYSPLLELTTIRIDGTARIDAEDVHSAVDEQLGTPLALIDHERITTALSEFPLIRSYVTEAVPPDTLVIHIVERAPIGSVPSGSGFALVDPAGIVIERSQERIAGVPLIELADADTSSTAFDAAVEVLLALPDPVLSRLDTVTATTRDDVRLTLAGGGAQIVWGSADDSELKAQVLAAALAQNFPNVSVYNVSAPGQFSYR